MKRTPKRIPGTQKAISTNSKTLDEIIIVMIFVLSLGSRDKRRMTNSPWAVGTNGKFTESATFHNSARRQLSTKRRSSWPKGPEQGRNSLRPFLSGATRRNSHGPPSATIFTLPNTFPASAECQPHPVNSNTNSNNNKSPKTKRQRQSKDKEEGRDYKILMCLSIRHKLYNYHLCIYILLDRPLI